MLGVTRRVKKNKNVIIINIIFLYRKTTSHDNVTLTVSHRHSAPIGNSLNHTS